MKEVFTENAWDSQAAELEVEVCGEGFTAGKKSNAAIASLLHLDDDAPHPDFCNDAAACLDALEAEGRVPLVKPTEGGKWVAIFDHNGAVAATKPFRRDSHALAAALFFVLESKSRMT